MTDVMERMEERDWLEVRDVIEMSLAVEQAFWGRLVCRWFFSQKFVIAEETKRAKISKMITIELNL